MRWCGSVLRVLFAASVLALAGCSAVGLPTPPPAMGPRPPLEIRTGAADMLVERAEPEVSREEVAAAVQQLVGEASMCFPWPGLWIDENRWRNEYIARFDLMTRDWGADIADASRVRMQEFVDLGFLSVRDRPDLGAGAVQYTLTPAGGDYLRGSPYGVERPIFCAPSERRVVEVARMEFGAFPCGNLRVAFSHTSDAWPTWARTASVQARVAAEWGAPGAVGEGTVTLARQWWSRDAMPVGVSQNGALRSVCYDAAHQRVTGDDLSLRPPP